MSQENPRRGVLTLKTLGRGFWFGIIASLALHALLVTTGRFQMQRWEDATTLETRIEPEELEVVPLPKPEPVSKPVTIDRPQKQPEQQSGINPPEPLAAPPVQPPTQSADEPAPIPPPSFSEQAVPQPPVDAAPMTNRPYALLTQAAQNIRELPERVEIVYELQGMLSGRQTHVWQRSSDRYTLEAESEATGLAGLFVQGKMIQKSQGIISSLGLMPEQYESQRATGKKEILRFDYKANLIESIRIDSKHGTRKQELPLITGVQDPLSLIYQLAMAARGDKDGLLVTASAKRVKGYPYRTVGIEKLSTALGEISAVHVTREGDSGKGAVHLWLAPKQHYLPVRVSYVDEDGSEWVLDAVDIKTQ